MRLLMCLLPLIIGVLSTSVDAQSSISVVGRVVNASLAPLDRVEVTLGIAAKANPNDRIVSDLSNSHGLFQLAKSTVGNFSELYLWIEEPYSYAPTPVTAVKTDMWRKKIDDIVLQRTLVGAIPPNEVAERVAAIYSIEQIKSKLGIQNSDVSKETAKRLAKGVLAKCENIQQDGMLNSVVAKAANLVRRDNGVFSEAQQSLLALADQNDFTELAKSEQERHDGVTTVLTSYLQGKQSYSGSIAAYVNGLSPAAIKPEWFVDREASKRVWVSLRPKSGDVTDDLFMLGSLKPEMMGGHVVRWKPTGLQIDVNKPPNTEDVEEWFQLNPYNAKILFKAIILADPNLSDDKKAEIDKDIKAAAPIVIPKK